MTVKTLHQAIGQTVGLRLEGFIIPMTVLDVKTSYGKARFLVSPNHGSGEQWVEISRLVALPSTGSDLVVALESY